jgi:hypothetical protein
MYAAGRLQGCASAWWDAYTAAHATPDTITWDEFTINFRSHHIPSGVMKIKKKEFLSLKQGGMSVSECRDKFTELSCYAAEDVAEDRKKQEMFLDGLAGSLQYQLMSYTFPNFQQFQQSAQQFQRPVPQTPRPASQPSQQRAPVGTPVRSVAPPNPTTTTCFKCGELGHYANACPKRNPPHTPLQNQQQTRSRNQTPQTNKGQQSYARGKAIHVDAEVAQENPRVMLDMFLVNSTPASVLFDSGASNSFITSQFVAQHNIPISPMPRHMLVTSLGGN